MSDPSNLTSELSSVEENLSSQHDIDTDVADISLSSITIGGRSLINDAENNVVSLATGNYGLDVVSTDRTELSLAEQLGVIRPVMTEHFDAGMDLSFNQRLNIMFEASVSVPSRAELASLGLQRELVEEALVNMVTTEEIEASELPTLRKSNPTETLLLLTA